MRVLLTGSQGQVGQAICETVQRLKHLYPDLELIPCDKKTLDITDQDSLKNIIIKYSPDYIINTAAYTAVDKAELDSEKDLVWAINVKGPENLAKICTEKNILLIHLSTDYVFDGLKKSAYTESDIPNPISYYGQSKLQGERAITKYCQNSVILRVSWVFSEYGQNPLKNLIKLMQEREILNMVSDQTACPTYAVDIAEVLLSIINNSNHKLIFPSGIYHYCNSPAVSRFELAKIIYHIGRENKNLNFKNMTLNPIPTLEYPTPAERPLNSVLNCDLITKKLNITLKSWQDNLKHCMNIIGQHGS